MNKLILLCLLVFFSCSSGNELKINGRTFIYDSSIEGEQADLIAHQIDTILNRKEYVIMDTSLIAISKNDSILNIDFKRKDTVYYYLKSRYQEFTNKLGYNLSNKKIMVEVTYDHNILDKYVPHDSIVYSNNMRWRMPNYVELVALRPISDKQFSKTCKYMENILGYISYDSDSSFSKIYLYKNKVILEIPFKKDWKIDKNGAKFFKQTANQISDSAFWGWTTEVRLLDESNNVRKKFHNVDTTFVFIEKDATASNK